MGSGTGRQRRGSTIMRMVALLLLIVIGTDLAADANCDAAPSPSRSATTMQAATVPNGPSGPSDPCARTCVPDCFCCSMAVAGGPMLVLPKPSFVTACEPRALESWPEGVHPVADRPPLPRA
jgi:hypothetical protein